MDSRIPRRIIKIGGQSADDPNFLEAFAKVLESLNAEVVVVHGGGDSISELERRVYSREPRFVSGKRQTDEKTLQLAEMVLCAAVNKKIVRHLALHSKVNPVGISGQDGHILMADVDTELGCVARNVVADPKLILDLCRLGYTPVLAPLALSRDGDPLNANADDAACAVAQAMEASELIFLTNVSCVSAGSSRLAHLSEAEAETLIAQGIISGGMIVKVRAAIEAAKSSGTRVRICNLESLASGKDTVIDLAVDRPFVSRSVIEQDSRFVPVPVPVTGGLPRSSLAPLFAKNNLQLEQGDGMYLTSAEGQRYLDFSSGIAVNALGHKHPALVAAIHDNAEKPLHLSNLFRMSGQERLAEKLVSSCFAEHVFFSNSGTEANEAAIKFAFKYHFARGDHERRKVVAFKGGFHGRTLGALSVTEKLSYRQPFQHGLFEADFLEFNESSILDTHLSTKTAAVIVEPVQGESGIFPAHVEFMSELRRLCSERGIVLIFDEVQCGLMRTGLMWAHQNYGVEPDILTTAKPLGGGLPLGATLISSQISESLSLGDHGSTFGGNPLSCALANVVFDEVCNLQKNICAVGDLLGRVLARFKVDFPHIISAVRGRGLMWGFDVRCSVSEFVALARAHGLLLLSAGSNTVRLLPPLICTESDVNDFENLLTKVLAQISAESREAVTLRAADIADVTAIFDLISSAAERRELLPRSRESVEQGIDRFIAAEWNGVLVGCVSIKDWSSEYREVRSLAVVRGAQGQGIGRRLLAKFITDSRAEGIREIFALTLCPLFFQSSGFSLRTRDRYSFKEKDDCLKCEFYSDCREIAVGLELDPVVTRLPLEMSVHENL